jgi:integrase
MAGSSGAHERKARAPRPAVRSSAVLKALPRNGERVFPLSNMAINQLLRGMRPGGGVVPHGFRSTFRDWAAERTAYPSDVVEMALAHATKSKTEAAYRRGDLFERRRKLMGAWAEFCASSATSGSRVVPLRA